MKHFAANFGLVFLCGLACTGRSTRSLDSSETTSLQAHFALDGDPLSWAQTAELAASDSGSGSAALFGSSVAVIGGTALVGAPRQNLPIPAGAAYVFVQSGGGWAQTQKLEASDAIANDGFGATISVSGGTALIGASGHSAAYVFAQQTDGGWAETQKLLPTDGGVGDNFGVSVFVSGGLAIVGANHEKVGANLQQGAAYLFAQLGDGGWAQQQALVSGDGVTGDWFGNAVSLSGSTALVGASLKAIGGLSSQGAAYVFAPGADGGWVEQQELLAADGTGGDLFGGAVAVSGGVAVVGASSKSFPGGLHQGAAYVFGQSSDGGWAQVTELLPTGALSGDFFGASVSVAGGTAAVGASGKNVGADGGAVGAAYMFQPGDAGLIQTQELTSSDGVPMSQFGAAVSTDGTTVLVGAYQQVIAGQQQGAAYVFSIVDAGTGGDAGTAPDAGSTSDGGVDSGVPAPVLTSVQPDSGTTAGGTAVTLTGANFLPGASVAFGSALATQVTVVSPTSITATTPAQPAGLVDVSVFDTDGQNALLRGAFRYVPILGLTSVQPDSGTTAGGTAVTLTGANFLPGASVAFGSALATQVTVVSPTSITATTPAQPAGLVDVSVFDTDGQNALLRGGFRYVPILVLTSVQPDSGTTAGGTAVTLTGANFLPGASVVFGSALATQVTVVSPTSITATTPAQPAGLVDVSIFDTDGQSALLRGGFRYASIPVLTSVQPDSGTTAGGTAVTLTGGNFLPGASVVFGSALATQVTVVSPTSITATTPAQPAGLVDVSVFDTDGQSALLRGGFRYVPILGLTSVQPDSGTTAGGTAVTLTGGNFLPGASVVFGSALATQVTVVSPTSITATTPAQPAGAVDVSVFNTNGQSVTLSGGFLYTAPAADAGPGGGSSKGGGCAASGEGLTVWALATGLLAWGRRRRQGQRVG